MVNLMKGIIIETHPVCSQPMTPCWILSQIQGLWPGFCQERIWCMANALSISALRLRNCQDCCWPPPSNFPLQSSVFSVKVKLINLPHTGIASAALEATATISPSCHQQHSTTISGIGTDLIHLRPYRT